MTPACRWCWRERRGWGATASAAGRSTGGGRGEVDGKGGAGEPLTVGEYFGDISMIDGLPRSATVVAGPDGLTTFALSALAFEPVVKENPDVAQALLKALTARIRSLESES